ncbi:hypothetical protein AVEN_119928-1 [Araneus ventricosus]|uniref:RNase H type-1 domain-containing protein n=1 Tax=Araneus ventricosus TaxID=182803 RepID=A0A4Y2I051_ARAVE|nr:hypothetical protein AVEN_119928-1 [Araneus ventricosus]
MTTIPFGAAMMWTPGELPLRSSLLPIIFLLTIVRKHFQPLPAAPPKAGQTSPSALTKLAANPKCHNSIALKIFKLLHSHLHIKVSWIKAHAGYIGNEEADRLAKEAVETEKFPETPLEFSKTFIKTLLHQKMLVTWQMAWDDGDTGRLIHNIIPKLACDQSTGHVTKFCFSQDMGLSLRFSKDSILPKPHSVLVGESAHQSIMLWFAFSQPPTI